MNLVYSISKIFIFWEALEKTVHWKIAGITFNQRMNFCFFFISETVQIVDFGFLRKKAISVNFRTWGDLKKISRPFLLPHTCYFVMRISFWIRANILQKKTVKKQKGNSKTSSLTLLKLKTFRIRLCDWKVYLNRDFC